MINELFEECGNKKKFEIYFNKWLATNSDKDSTIDDFINKARSAESQNTNILDQESLSPPDTYSNNNSDILSTSLSSTVAVSEVNTSIE